MAEARLARILERRDAAPEGSARRAELDGQARTVAREVACRRSDLYSTRKYQQLAEQQLADMIAADANPRAIRALAATIAEGRLMDRYRREQAALMPPAQSMPAARHARQTLGDARFDMAQARIRMDMSAGNPSEWQHWQQQHLEAAQRASLAAAELRAITDAHTADAWTAMPPDQQRELRDTIANDGTFNTPVAPRRYRDVLDETQDIIDGITPVREPVDDAGVAPFGDAGIQTDDTSWRHADDAGGGQTPVGATADSNDAPQRRPGRPVTRAASLRRQAGRRAKRRGRVTAEWRRMRASARRLEQLDRRTDPIADNVVSKELNESGSMFDLTLLSLIMEKVGPQR